MMCGVEFSMWGRLLLREGALQADRQYCGIKDKANFDLNGACDFTNFRMQIARFGKLRSPGKQMFPGRKALHADLSLWNPP